MTDLMHRLGIEGRYFDSIDEARKAKAWCNQIDYNQVNMQLQLLRKESIEYLENVLQ